MQIQQPLQLSQILTSDMIANPFSTQVRLYECFCKIMCIPVIHDVSCRLLIVPCKQQDLQCRHRSASQC